MTDLESASVPVPTAAVLGATLGVGDSIATGVGAPDGESSALLSPGSPAPTALLSDDLGDGDGDGASGRLLELELTRKSKGLKT